MNRPLFLFWCIAIAAQPGVCFAAAPTLQEINLKRGNILGAALSPDSSVAYLEQLIFSEAALDHNQILKISAIDTRSLRARVSRTFPAILSKSRTPCGDLRAGIVSGRVYTCSGDEFIEVLDPDDLRTIRKIQAPENRDIIGFAVDEARDRLFLVTAHMGTNARLECINLGTGILVDSASLPVPGIPFGRVVINRDGSYLAVDIISSDKFGSKSNLFICAATRAVYCRERHGGVRNIGGLAFVRDKLLIVSGGPGDRKGSCVLSLDLDEDSPKKAFCDARSGVHFSAVEVGNKYLVAFTGLNRFKPFTDFEIPLWSAISVWDLTSRKESGTVSLPKDFTTYMSAATLVGSDQFCFLAYQASYMSPIAFVGRFEETPR